jgi:hypothetical protein
MSAVNMIRPIGQTNLEHNELAYAVLSIDINFCFFAGLSYWVLKSMFSNTADSDLSIKGTIYTESEIEEFKRRGLM